MKIRDIITQLNEAHRIVDLINVRSLLLVEGIASQSLENAIKSCNQENIEATKAFIYGPLPEGVGVPVMTQLERNAILRGE